MSHDDEEKKVIRKFCLKTAPLIDRLSVDPIADERAAIEHVSAATSSPANLYGCIRKEDMEKILNAYELQQKSPKKQDKPIVCDGVVGSSFAKLLYSRVGFHNLDSTAHLVKSLGIRDYNRDSFLGGHSSYSLPKHETIEGILKNENRYVISQMMKEAHECINSNNYSKADALIKSALEIDKNNGDALGARGKYYAVVKNDHKAAVEDYNMALKYNPLDVDTIKRNFAKSMFNFGYNFYLKRNFREAKQLFENAIKMDPSHESARLHLDLSLNHLQSNNMLAHERANTSYRK